MNMTERIPFMNKVNFEKGDKDFQLVDSVI